MKGKDISLGTGSELCRRYREKHKLRLFSQCWGCVKFSKGDPKKMCFYNGADNRGCSKVNSLFDNP
ncbi:MAG: hypothetical protein ACMUHY_05900 [Thermoplasmatota archaeon]